MKNHSMKQPPTQLALFENTGLEHWEDVRRAEINGVMFYSVLDIFKFYGDSSNPTMAWKQTKERLRKQGFRGSNDLLEHSFDGKGQRNTPVATLEVFLRIAQSTNFKHWEDVRRAMSGALAEKIENAIDKKMRQTINYYESFDMGNKPEILLLRSKLEARQSLYEIKSLISQLVDSPNFQDFHTEEYRSLLGVTVGAIKKARNAKSVRDSLNVFEYNALTHGERDLIAILSMQGNVDNQRLLDNVRLVFTPLGENLRTMLESIGIDVLSGQPLLPK